MADHYLIESRWTGNIVTTPSSGTSSSQAVPEPFYDTKQPGQIKHRGMPKKDAGRPMMVRQDGITAVSSAPVSPVTETHAVASEAQQQQQLKLVHMGPQAGVVTWPRPQPTTDDNVEQRKRVMRNWRGAAALNSGGILLDRDQLYRIEAEGMALDMALSHVSSKMKVAPENFSRSTVKLVQRAVAQTVTKFDELFATRELAPIAELRQLILKTVDELGFSQDKLVSSLSSIDDIKSVAGLTSACGKGGQRPAMEDRHVCLPHFFTLTHVSTIAQDAFFCAVYDGHAGPLAAEFCRLQLHLNMVREHHSKDWPGAIRAAFHVTDQQFREIANVRDLKDGTTATVILIEDGTLYHANVGDGEGFLHWKDGRITPVTKAHKVSDRDEVARIEELEKRKKTRVLLNLGPGGMAVSDPDGNYMRVSRSIGDRCVACFLVSSLKKKSKNV
jgi:serine/threonine protein phosphatase PrpC